MIFFYCKVKFLVFFLNLNDYHHMQSVRMTFFSVFVQYFQEKYSNRFQFHSRVFC